MLIYPRMTALDLIGPQTFLSALMNVQVHLLWKESALIVTDSGIPIHSTATFSECPKTLDVLFVPGGAAGTVAVMEDQDVLAFVADRGARAKYVTSVCTGSLVLGSAGLLKGYKATSHWSVRDVLPLLGAEPVSQRVVVDRNRITGAGVTSGIDFGLVLAAQLRGKSYAQMLQLAFEYDPQPPFQAGTPEKAPPDIAEHTRQFYAPNHDSAMRAAREAQVRLHLA
jgi:cyclohexyl-isocyanide hydratase